MKVSISAEQRAVLSELFNGMPMDDEIDVQRFDYFAEHELGVQINGRNVRIDTTDTDPNNDVQQSVEHIIELISKHPSPPPGRRRQAAKAAG